jgi:oxygen-independent coproporphyrinogen-3 oxidase
MARSMGAAYFADMATLAVYIQIPFCASKCSFCNFSSGVERETIFAEYGRNLLREIEGWQESFAVRGIPSEFLTYPLDSIYIGGGTPTLLGEERLASLVSALKGHLIWGADIEFTLETTPGSANPHGLGALRALGVNRLSIGVQTFDDRELRAVGRLHSAGESGELVRGARQAGFQNVSVDLIAGLPYQTKESFRHSLEEAVKLRPEHVSLYLFEIDEKSRLGREVIHGGNRYHAAEVPGEELVAEAYEFGCTFLANEGYTQYEISNFALPEFESRHNRKYWQLAPYVGLGAGAHSFDGTRRWSNRMDVRGYNAQLGAGHTPIEEFRVLPSEEQVEEFFFLGLRQAEGIDLNWARERWGAGCLKLWESKIESLARGGWVVLQGNHARLQPKAYLVSNEIFQEFVST